MNYNDDVIYEYIKLAPLALALERIVESRLYSNYKLEHPILDLGCGEGLFAHVVSQDKIDTGIDPNLHELERAKELGAYIELLECSGDNIPKPDSSYKTIISNSVLEHIPDLEPVLKEAYRILEPGGNFYFTVPSEKFEQYTFITYFLHVLRMKTLEQMWRKFFNQFWAHYHYKTPDGWSLLGQSAGFEVVEVYAYSPRRTCMLNTFLTPFGLPAMIIKKITNRWVLWPGFRKLIMMPIKPVIPILLNNAGSCNNGGLVFVALRKPVK